MSSQATTALLDSWGRSLHDKAPSTIRLYREIADRFARWLVEHRGDDDLTAVTRRDVEAWFAEQAKAGLSQSTQRSRWISLRNLYKWLEEEDELAGANPMAKVKVAKAEPGPLPVPTDADVRAILATCTGKSLKERRDHAIILVMAATGMRVAEITNLDLADVDLNSRCIVVRKGKMDRTRLVRIDASTAAALDRYLRVRGRSPHANEPALWLSRITAPDGTHRYARKSVMSMFTLRAKKAGVDHIHPHQLRHLFADRWLRNGGAEGDLMRLGGWEDASIMRRYGRHHAVERALAAYDEVAANGLLANSKRPSVKARDGAKPRPR